LIRLAAMACGLLCGIGMLLSGLFRPSLLPELATPAGSWDLVIGLLSAIGVSAGIMTSTTHLPRPLLGGEVDRIGAGSGWKAVTGGVMFGLGWGLAGYFPLAALVSAGLLAPGGVIFLASLLGGMRLHDVVVHRDRRARFLG
jgi:hypothetical protein